MNWEAARPAVAKRWRTASVKPNSSELPSLPGKTISPVALEHAGKMRMTKGRELT